MHGASFHDYPLMEEDSEAEHDDNIEQQQQQQPSTEADAEAEATSSSSNLGYGIDDHADRADHEISSDPSYSSNAPFTSDEVEPDADANAGESDQRQLSSPPSLPRHVRPGLSVLVTHPPSAGSPGSSTGKIPAAGAGTRTGPRPVPRSSSALRHVSGSRSKVTSFAALPEDGPSTSSSHRARDTGSTVQRQIEADARRKRQLVQQEDYWPLQAVDDDDDDEYDEYDDDSEPKSDGRPYPSRPYPARHIASESSSSISELPRPGIVVAHDSDEGDSDRAGGAASRDPKGKGKAQPRSKQRSDSTGDLAGWTTEEDQRTTENDSDARREPDGDDDDDDDDDDPRRGTNLRRALHSEEDELGRSPPRRARWHPRGPPPPRHLTGNGLQTPGISFPPALNTPLGGSPNASSPEMEAHGRHRLEWHTMLASVLASEVLQSETKRITSVDAPDLSKTEIMYRRWLDIRASLRGRGHLPGAVDAEEKRLRRDWPEMLKNVIADIKSYREPANADSATMEDTPEETPPQLATATRSQVHDELEQLLAVVDNAESQFPSLRKAVETVPEWGEAAMQSKLETLRAWFTISSLLRSRLQRLQEWTGSETLQIDIPQKQHSRNDDATSLVAKANGETEGLTFVERILKEGSVKSTFESKTLASVEQVVLKARDTIKANHATFQRWQLPSFSDEIAQLVSFPLRLMERALELRIDYAGKIKEPSPLIVDSLTDDVRTALDMALRTKQNYQAIIVPDPDKGWDLKPAIGPTYEETLRHALRFFFRLISFKLKGSVFFKETEILDNEWRFLGHAIAVIEGGDVIVAKRLTKIVNELFARIETYFKRELAAPSTTRGKSSKLPLGTTGSVATATVAQGQDGITRGPSLAGGLTKGHVHLTLAEKVKWIHAVFDNVRIRSRKLLGLAREVRNRLDNAAEYDLASLRPPTDLNSEDVDVSGDGLAGGAAAAHSTSTASAAPQGMDLNAFMQTLINADYFLVYTESYEEKGIYIIAEPSLHDKPEVIQELLGKCMMKVAQKTSLPTQADPVAGSPEAGAAAAVAAAAGPGQDPVAANADAEETTSMPPAPTTDDDVPPKYLLLLTPRDPFMWTGRVMTHKIDPVEIELKDRRLRLIADGPKERLQRCKTHFYSVFAAADRAAPEKATKGKARRNRVPSAQATTAAAATASTATQPLGEDGRPNVPPGFPLDVINENMAHMADVQTELRSINKGVYLLSVAILQAVPKVRRNMRRRRSHAMETGEVPGGLGSESDELIQNCFGMASEQGFRSLPFIESKRLRGYMTSALAYLAIDWVCFICDDCVPSDRKTFKWAVAALENAAAVTRDEQIFHLKDAEFDELRQKVASCVALLISHFDILGARSSVAKAAEEAERLQREKAERNRIAEQGINPEEAAERLAAAHRMVEGTGGCGVGAPPMLNRAESGMQAIEERWVQKMIEWDDARHDIESEQRLIGRVLDDTRLEDQGLQFLASSSSRIQIRWQQGRFIGSGTFGTVYLAVNMDSGGLMAVKEIRFADISNNTSLYKNIKDEMNVMEMLHHPNIVDYYGIEVHRDKVYIFEEYCQGGSLAQLLEHGRIEDEAVIQVYTLQMLDGLVYLHSQGVVHRDIKPDNILLDHQGVIKFVDFGAAKVLAKNSRTVQKSRRGFTGGAGNMAGMVGPDGKPVGAAAVQSLQGTPMYMSPEVIKGESRGRRGAMDVWSLGCVVLEFATGRRPWSQLDNEWAIMFHIGMAQQHPPLPEPGQLSELGIDFIRQCLNIDPYERPSAAEMRDHPWIQELVDQIDAAANEEEALDATSTVASQDYFANSATSDPSLSSSAQTSISGAINGGGEGTPSLKAGTAAGVAAMAVTPGTRSISSYVQSRGET